MTKSKQKSTISRVTAILIAMMLAATVVGIHFVIQRTSVMPVSVAQATALPGAGTAENPFLISTGAELQSLNDFLGPQHSNTHFRMTRNINLAAEGVPLWTPIGGPGTGGMLQPFYGNFDGGGFSIFNLTINNPDQDYMGLFGFTRNAHIQNIAIGAGSTIVGGVMTGGIVGWAENTIIIDTYNRGMVGSVADIRLPIFTVTFDPNGGVIEAGNDQQTVDFGHNATPPTVTRLGHTFVEWVDAEGRLPGPNPYNFISRDSVFEARWQINTYTVQFVLGPGEVRTGGGELIQQITFGQAAQLPIVTRPGHIFVGWAPVGGGVGAPDNIQGNTNFAAVWQVGQFVITFDPNFPAGMNTGLLPGSTPLTSTHNSGARIEAPRVFAERASLTGWAPVGNGNGTFGIALEAGVWMTAPVDGSRTFRATWQLDSHTVTFDADWGTFAGGGNIRTQTVAHGGNATAPQAPTRDGWVFLGWDATLNNITSDTTLNARWEIDPAILDPGGIAGMLSGGMIARSANSGEINGEIAGGIVGTMANGAQLVDVYNIGPVSGISPTSIVGGIVGHLVSGSITNAYSTGGIFMVDTATNDPLTLEGLSAATMGGIVGLMETPGAVATPGVPGSYNNIVNVFYDVANVANALHAIGGRPNTTAFYGRNAVQLRQQATFAGFDFVNVWRIDEGRFTPRLVASPGTVVPVMFDVTFNANGGNFAAGSTSVVAVPIGANVPAASVPTVTRVGHTFLGWSTNQGATAADPAALNNVRADRTVFAVWTQQVITVTFHGNGGLVGGQPTFSQNIMPGGTPNPPQFLRAHSWFIGWNANQNATVADPGALIGISNSITLFAIWGHTLRFEFNGGRLVSGNQTATFEERNVEPGASTVPPQLTRAGYVFAGWSPSGVNFNNVTAGGVFTAQWTPAGGVLPPCSSCNYPGCGVDGTCCGDPNCPGPGYCPGGEVCNDPNCPGGPDCPIHGGGTGDPPFGGGIREFFAGFSWWVWVLLLVLLIILLIIAVILIFRIVSRSRETKAVPTYCAVPAMAAVGYQPGQYIQYSQRSPYNRQLPPPSNTGGGDYRSNKNKGHQPPNQGRR